MQHRETVLISAQPAVVWRKNKIPVLKLMHLRTLQDIG